jgi:hypothetical protein
MADVIKGNPKTIEHLREGDVTAVFTNTKGDYNGGVGDSMEPYMHSAQRTLSFELNQPSDIYRHMLLLKARGIKPATIVFVAHGQAGVMPLVQANKEAPLLVNTHYPDDERDQQGDFYNIMEARGLRRIVGEMMQDSRGIDDNAEAVGRRRIIFSSCFQAKPVNVLRYQQQRGMKWLGSVARHRPTYDPVIVQESMAETVTKTAATSNLDVYAGDDVFATIRTDNGVRYHTFEDKNDKTGKPLQATHFRLDKYGNVITQRIDQIVLRQTNDKIEGGTE